MSTFVWIGAAVTLVGVAGIVGSAVAAHRARSADLPDAALRARLGRLVAWNLGAFAVAILGLMSVIVALFFG